MTEMYDNINAVPDIENKRYLEIGPYEGFIFKHIKAGEKYGVDMDLAKFRGERSKTLFDMTSDKLFAKLDKEKSDVKFDVVFIDGAHDYISVLKDYNNSVKRLNKDGYIFIHDTYPLAADQAIPELCGTAYRICYALAKHKQAFVFCMHSMEGLGEYPQLVIKNPKPISKGEVYDDITYQQFWDAVKDKPIHIDSLFIDALDKGEKHDRDSNLRI